MYVMKKQHNNSKRSTSDSLQFMALIIFAVFLLYMRIFGIAAIDNLIKTLSPNIIGAALIIIGLLCYTVPLYRFYFKKRKIRLITYGWGTIYMLCGIPLVYD